MTADQDDRRAAVAELARTHGIAVVASSLRFNEAGLDYQVAFAPADDGTEWVLRIPRRPDVSAKVQEEARILDLVKRTLSVAVPDWRVRHEDLIAYPSLPGRPGLTVDSESGEPQWHVDPDSPGYARSLGRLIAELHQIDTDAAKAATIPYESPADVREGWRRNLERVHAEFPIATDLLDRWNAWLADDTLWPEYTVLTHGELYPAHTLLTEDDTIASVLDWTTAKVSDPALDFSFHHMTSTPETFALTVETYAELTGRTPARLVERCTELTAAWPINYGLYALATGDPDHAAAAGSQLNPTEPPR